MNAVSQPAVPQPSASQSAATSSTVPWIVVDAMGGDFSPKNEVLGAIEALKEHPGKFRIIFTGPKAEIEKAVSAAGGIQKDLYEIVDAAQVITMEDEPVAALRQKRDSSIVRGFDLVKSGRAKAFVSAGNTGAVMSGGTLLLGRIPGVSRPTIGSQFPREDGSFSMVFDVGATVDSKAIHLKEYAIMGTIYSREILGIKNPRVAIMSVGEERSKGNELVFQTTELLEKTNLNFIGNVEGRDVLGSAADVIVCDGFVGNIILKFAESVVTSLRARLRAYSNTGLLAKLKAGIVASVLRVVLKDYDYQEYGGVPLLGVNGVTIIGHGRSTPKALKNMILKAEEMIEKRINERIQEELAKNVQEKDATEVH